MPMQSVTTLSIKAAMLPKRLRRLFFGITA